MSKKQSKVGDKMAKAFSDLDIYDAKSFLRIDYDLDDMFIEMALDSAKSYVCPIY